MIRSVPQELPYFTFAPDDPLLAEFQTAQLELSAFWKHAQMVTDAVQTQRDLGRLRLSHITTNHNTSMTASYGLAFALSSISATNELSVQVAKHGGVREELVGPGSELVVHELSVVISSGLPRLAIASAASRTSQQGERHTVSLPYTTWLRRIGAAVIRDPYLEST